MTPTRRPLALAVSLALCGAAAAQERQGATLPLFGPGNYQRLATSDVWRSWNGGPTDAILRPGLKLMFFGELEGCPSGTEAPQGGPLQESFDGARWRQLAELTGLPPGRQGQRHRWAPAPDPRLCRGSAADDAPGELAFAQLNTDPDEGGLGLYSVSGPQTRFKAYGPGGQGRTGANADIQGSFVHFRQAWNGPDPFRPWAGGPESTLQLRSRQGVAQVQAGSARTPEGEVQVKQQLGMTVINPRCLRENRPGQRRLCQIQYLFNTAVYRSGVNDWSRVAWFQQASVMGDPAQGAMPVVHGPVGEAGRVAVDAGSQLPLYRSEGAASQHQPFADRLFDLRVRFRDLLAAQRVIVGRQLRRAPENLRAEELEAEFGPDWNRPEAWVLLDVNVGQEAYNRGSRETAAIGGQLRLLEISSLPR
ncbi:hypothetical protein [Ideonella alba]|uniref:Uncharacterized protein n=1 Tax=Ideonella alba TaxID=2824118 RepID=A0A940YAG9_9BURK|nr:hypothetical protein [Ideonella alba]MBQ0929157.1 hypothetical protein [Ideonella alba]